MKTISCILVCIVAAIGSLRAEPPREPEKMAAYFLKRLAALDFTEVADFTHPSDLAKYKALHVEAARLAEEIGVTHYYELLPWAKSSQEIEAMPPKTLYVSVLNGLFEMLRTQAPEQFEAMMDQIKGMKFTVIGHIMDGDEVMLVNYRITHGEGDEASSEVHIMPLRRKEADWLLGIAEENFEQVQINIDQFKRAKEANQQPQPRTVSSADSRD